MAKEDNITTIRVPKSVKDELQKVALPKESMHLTIQRILNEKQQLVSINEKNEDIIRLYKEKELESINDALKGMLLDTILLKRDLANPIMEAYDGLKKDVEDGIDSQISINHYMELLHENKTVLCLILDVLAMHDVDNKNCYEGLHDMV